ncbi:hypothetical protein [Nostoc sp.]|uniref:hypothetical protein n=1 Tax=Nostoc sp. TaxID=1180 RepID=UPI002FF574FF
MVVEGRNRKACGIATLRAQPLVELGIVEVAEEQNHKACGIATLRAQPLVELGVVEGQKSPML